MSVQKVVGLLKVHKKRLLGYEDKEEEKHLLLTHEEGLARTKKKMMRLTLLIQVRRDVVAITRKTEVVDVVVDMVADVVVKEAVTIPHKFVTIPTRGRIRV